MTDAPAIKQNANGIWMLDGEQLWDSDILPVCLDHIKEGDTVIDAGAWIGGHAMAYAKKVGKTGWVHAFEPNRLAYECLQKNVDNLRVLRHNVVLGDEERMVPFSAKKSWYDSGHVGDDQLLNEVWQTRLDPFNISPNFIKIDVEGCELKVLTGATKTIEKHRPKMMIELNQSALERQGNTPQQVVEWLHEHDYAYEAIDDHTNDVYNILALP